MNKTASQAANGGAVVDEAGRKTLAIPTGVSGPDFVRSEIGSLQRQPGWIVRDGGIEPWEIRGFTQRDGQINFWGDYLPGVRLEDCLDDDAEASLGRLKSLTAALIRLRAEKTPVFPLRTDGVFFLEDRSVLFLPPAIMQRISILRPYAERVRTFHVINSPELSGEKQLAFSIGSLAYRMLLGCYPFTGEDDVEVNRRIRSLKVTPPSLQRPEIMPELSDTITRSIDASAKERPGLDEWDAVLFRAISEGYLREVSQEEKAEAEVQARQKAERSQKSYRRAVFFQKNWRMIGVIGVVLAVVGSVAGSILSNVLAPRVTKGFSPQKVIETFYTSMNTLDHMTMEDCVVDKAGQGEVNEAMNLYVLSRATVGYEGKSYIVSAEEWEKAGRPVLSAESQLYGAILKEVQEEQGEPEPIYLVSYQKWAPQPEESGSDDETRRNFGYDRVDRVSLRIDKEDWVIYKIDRVSSMPVDDQ